MNLKFTNETIKPNVTTFTLSGVDVSIANAIRRTVLGDISTVVFRTSPNKLNQCEIFANTTRFHNEIVKQRLACIPIHVKYYNLDKKRDKTEKEGKEKEGNKKGEKEGEMDEIDVGDLYIEVDVENNTDDIMYVTTKDFQVKSLTNQPITKGIFPPFKHDNEEEYIEFLRLRPKVGNDIPGEHIHLRCPFSVCSAKIDGMYNVVAACAYACTVDVKAQEKQLKIERKRWEDEKLTENELNMEIANWKLLKGKRIVLPNSFDFIVESVGVYENMEIIQLALQHIINKLYPLLELQNVEIESIEHKNTLRNSYDIVLKNEDYTLGKPLEHIFYTKYFMTGIFTYSGFIVMHPESVDGILRVACKDPTDKNSIQEYFKTAVQETIAIFTNIQESIS